MTHQRPSSEPSDVLARLLQAAGRRSGPPLASHTRSFAIVYDAWQQRLRARRVRRKRLIGGLALAATLACLAIGFAVFRQPAVAPLPLARMERAIGTVQAQLAAGSKWTALTDEAWFLLPGSRVRTATGSRAGLLLTAGISVRLAEATEIELVSAGEVLLKQGRVYVDTNSDATRVMRQIVIATPVGRVSDLGTQFEVQYMADSLRIRVRGGAIVLNRNAGREHTAAAGEQLLVASDNISG